MTSKENFNENLHKPISGIFVKKFMGPHCKALNENLRKSISVIFGKKFMGIPIAMLWM
jgi:hypothetical protein